MSSPVTTVAVLLLGWLPALDSSAAAPVPASANAASESFERFKKALPETVDEWTKKTLGSNTTAKVILARQIGKEEAKVIIQVDDNLFAILFLQHFRGTWTVTRMKADWDDDQPQGLHYTLTLHVAIDKAGGRGTQGE
jgi:hypothetical protein